MTTITNVFNRTALAVAMAVAFVASAHAQSITERAVSHPDTVIEQTSVTSLKTDSGKASYTETRPLDRIVAVVNNDIITEFELQNRAHQVALNLRRQQIELPPMETLRKQVLERLITETAIKQRARELNIRVDEQMVSAYIEQIARTNQTTIEGLRERLRGEGVSFSQFRQQIRDEIVFQRLREREVDAKIEIPESEVDAYLAEQAGFTTGDTTEYHIQHILLPLTSDEDANKDTIKLAKTVLAKAKDGEDFGKLAVTYSKAGDALSGGDLGWRDSTRMPSVFWQTIQTEPKAGFIAMAQSDNAVHIIKLVNLRDGVKAKLAGTPVEQTHVRHILLFVSDLTPEAEVISRLGNVKQRIENGEDFAALARLVSVDRSATRGGDLGWMQAGDSVPEFEAAMKALEPGQISDPIRTQYGYHLIQVLERRTQTMDATRSRLAARQTLREKKLSEAVATWQRELHDRAYVEIRTEHLQ